MKESCRRTLTKCCKKPSRTGLNLVNQEIAGIVILIVAYIIILYAAFQSKSIELRQLCGREEESNRVDPAKTAAPGGWLLLIATAILLDAAIRRYNQKRSEISAGETDVSIEPNVYVSAGLLLSTVGAAARAIGTQIAANEPVPSQVIL